MARIIVLPWILVFIGNGLIPAFAHTPLPPLDSQTFPHEAGVGHVVSGGPPPGADEGIRALEFQIVPSGDTNETSQEKNATGDVPAVPLVSGAPTPAEVPSPGMATDGGGVTFDPDGMTNPSGTQDPDSETFAVPTPSDSPERDSPSVEDRTPAAFARTSGGEIMFQNFVVLSTEASADEEIPEATPSADPSTPAEDDATEPSQNDTSVALDDQLVEQSNMTNEPQSERPQNDISVVMDSTTSPVPSSLRGSSTPHSGGSTVATPSRPKIRVPGGAAGRTRKPFVVRPPSSPPSSGAGGAVSLFGGRARTRLPSITSSTTTPRPPPQPTPRLIVTVPAGTDSIWTPTASGTVPTTTEEEEEEEEPFTLGPTRAGPVDADLTRDDVTLVKVAGSIAVERGLKWNAGLDNRHSPEYRAAAGDMHRHLERLFRSSPVAPRLWKIEVEGFSGSRKSRPVSVDFFLYLVREEGGGEERDLLHAAFREKLSPGHSFAGLRVDPGKTQFETVSEDAKPTRRSPEEGVRRAAEAVPQWAIAVVVVGAASLLFVTLFAAVTVYGRRRRRSRLKEEGADW